ASGWDMSGWSSAVPPNDNRPAVQFEPLRPASRRALVLGLVFGPVIWLVALIAVAATLRYNRAIELGLLVAVGSFLVSYFLLMLIGSARQRQEKRYAAGS